jgi:hypothetical protein
MEWLILGIVIGYAWHALLDWARAQRVHIGLLPWFLIILALVAGLSGVQNYLGLMAEYEERAAGMIPQVYGIQVAIPALLAFLLLWRQARRTARA